MIILFVENSTQTNCEYISPFFFFEHSLYTSAAAAVRVS